MALYSLTVGEYSGQRGYFTYQFIIRHSFTVGDMTFPAETRTAIAGSLSPTTYTQKGVTHTIQTLRANSNELLLTLDSSPPDDVFASITIAGQTFQQTDATISGTTTKSFRWSNTGLYSLMQGSLNVVLAEPALPTEQTRPQPNPTSPTLPNTLDPVPQPSQTPEGVAPSSASYAFDILRDIDPKIFDEIGFTQYADSVLLTHPTFPPIELRRQDVADSGLPILSMSYLEFDTIPRHNPNPTQDYLPFPIQPQPPFRQKCKIKALGLKDEDTGFDEGVVGQKIKARDGIGEARILTRLSNDEIEVWMDVPFGEFITQKQNAEGIFQPSTEDGIGANGWYIERGWVNAWSNEEGFPSVAHFHSGRLYLASTKTKPSTIWASRVGFPFDFLSLDGLDDSPFEITASEGAFNKITHIHGTQRLQVWTTAGEFYIGTTGEAITPSNVFIRQTSSNGTEEGLRPFSLENRTIFLKRGGKSLLYNQYSEQIQNYKTDDLTLLSSHMLSSGVKALSVRHSVSSKDGNRALMVNNKGELCQWILVQSEEVVCAIRWSLQNGKFVDVLALDDDIYVVCKHFLVCDNENRVYTSIARYDESLATDLEFPILNNQIQPLTDFIYKASVNKFDAKLGYSKTQATTSLNANIYNDFEIEAIFSTLATNRLKLTLRSELRDKAGALIPPTPQNSYLKQVILADNVEFDNAIVFNVADATITTSGATTSYEFASNTNLSRILNAGVSGNIDIYFKLVDCETLQAPFIAIGKTQNGIASFEANRTGHHIDNTFGLESAGFPINAVIETLPTRRDMFQPTANLLYPKLIPLVRAKVRDSSTLTINGSPLEKENEDGTFEILNGVEQVSGLTGYEVEPTIRIETNKPLNLELLEWRVVGRRR